MKRTERTFTTRDGKQLQKNKNLYRNVTEIVSAEFAEIQISLVTA